MMRRANAIVVAIALLTATSLCRAAPVKPVVLFDEAHGQRFLTGQTGPLDLSTLAGLFTAAGWDVRTTHDRFSVGTLAAVDAIVISGAFAPVTPEDAGSQALTPP